ncbi:MAG: exosortase H [Thermodesulfobacteriota bacterium]
MSRVFATRLLVLSGVLYAAASLAPPHYLDPLNRLTARMAGSSLGLFTGAPSVHGPLLTLSGFTVRIIPECTPLFVTILYVSFIVSYPAPWKDRALGLLLGVPALVLVNLLRLVVVIFLGRHYPRLFEAGHVYLGQFLMVLTVCLMSLAWLPWIHESPGTRLHASFLIRFFASSPLLFLTWIYLNKGYVLLGDRLISLVFSLFGYSLVMPRSHDLYYHTFNLALFGSLMLSAPSFPGLRGIKVLAGGLLLLCSLHLLVRVGNVLATGFGMPPALGIANALHVFGMYALPLLLWFRFIQRGPAGAARVSTRI